MCDEVDQSSSKMMEVQIPSSYLRRQELRLLDMPDFYDDGISPEFQQYLLSGDGLLFVLDARAPFMGTERDSILEIKRIAPNLPIHFLFNKRDMPASNQVEVNIEDEIKETVKAYFPNANVLTFTTNDDIHQQMSEFEIFLTNHYRGSDWKDKRAEKVLAFNSVKR